MQQWAEALKIPARFLWFNLAASLANEKSEASANEVISADAQDAHASTSPDGKNLHRRDFVKVAAGVSAVVAGGILAGAPWQRLASSLVGDRPVDEATVQLMEDRTLDFFYTEGMAPARQLVELLSRHRETLVSLAKNARVETLRNRLAVSVGETDALAGWVQFDLGNFDKAANAYRSALRIAKDAGDGSLTACALGYWSYLASAQNDVRPAIKLLQQAQDYVSTASAPATRSWIAAREAEELARLGDDTNALRALERSFVSFEVARPRTERPWTAFFSASRLGAMTVSTYTKLHHEDTAAAADSLLASLSPTESKQRAVVLAELTTAAAQDRNFDRANVLAVDAVELTARTGTTVAKNKLLTLASTLPAVQHSGSATELRDRIIGSLRVRRV
jgi:tetratricopeptide (TPR) repeat protein